MWRWSGEDNMVFVKYLNLCDLYASLNQPPLKQAPIFFVQLSLDEEAVLKVTKGQLIIITSNNDIDVFTCTTVC